MQYTGKKDKQMYQIMITDFDSRQNLKEKSHFHNYNAWIYFTTLWMYKITQTFFCVYNFSKNEKIKLPASLMQGLCTWGVYSLFWWA